MRVVIVVRVAVSVVVAIIAVGVVVVCPNVLAAGLAAPAISPVIDGGLSSRLLTITLGG